MNQEVTILSGTFKGMPAVVERIDGDQIHVIATLFGRQVPVTLQRAQVDLPPLELDRVEALRKRYGHWLAAQERLWWAARACEPQKETDLVDFQAWRPSRTLQDCETELAQVSADWPPAGQEHFDAWAATALPIQKWPQHPLVLQAIAEGQVTQSGTPKLSAEQWREARAEELAGQTRQERAWRTDWLNRNGPMSNHSERERSRAEIHQHAGVCRTRFRSVWGLELPDDALSFWAMWRASTPAELAILEFSGLRFGALFDALADPTPVNALDPRLHDRFYQAPPNYIPCAWGDTDGLHWGLWYERDDAAPFVAGFYARDGGGGFVVGRSLLDLVRDRAERLAQDATQLQGRERVELALQAELLESLADHFGAAGEPVESGIETVDGFGLRGDRSGIPQDRLDDRDIWETIRDNHAQTQAWETMAYEQLALGKPGFALLMGRDLHWLSMQDPEREARAAKLLHAAYTARGDEALAGIAQVHAAERCLGAQRVFARPTDTTG